MSRSKAPQAPRRPNGPPGGSAWLLGPLTALWMGLGIVDSVIGGIGWVAQPVYDWVRRLVDGVVGWVSTWINHVVDWAGRAFDDIAGAFRSVWDYATGLADWALHTIDTAVDRVVDWVGRGLQAARDLAVGLVDQLGRWAETAIGQVWDRIDGIFDWVIGNIWDPLWDKIEGIGSWVERTVVPWVAAGLDHLGQWVEDRFRWVTDHLCEFLGPTCPMVATMWDLLQRSWGWLAWLADHSISWFASLWHGLADSHPDVVEGMVARAFESGGDRIEAAVVRWFD